jgi:hypothetical protein
MNIPLQYLTEENFAPYGQIIGVNPNSSETFQVVLAEEDVSGWRIAVSNLDRRPLAAGIISIP